MRIEEKASFPRPDFIRENYLSLNGLWEFGFDDGGEIRSAVRLGKSPELGLEITVPFPYQSPASGIGSDEKHPYVVYKKRFFAVPGCGALLHFGAVDHDAEVWLNGVYLGSHSGGYTPFCFEVGDLLKAEDNELIVCVTDEFRRDTVRGKQIWEGEPRGCHYTAVTGIWQEVWLEYVPESYITRVKYITDFDSHSVTAEISFNKEVSGFVSLSVSKLGESVLELKQSVRGRSARCLISFEDCGLNDKALYNWSPKEPNLFDVSVCLECENKTDTVETYFGLRKVGVNDGKFYFNNSQHYLRMVLDQGYWSEGIYRPADDDGFRKDVELTLALGFNSARKHQKVEDPKYYYWADRLGLPVWGELPSFYSFTENACKDAENTLREFIERDFNHPSIIAWVPFNESWGLRNLLGDPKQADFARELYYLCKRLDPSRLVSVNDGWENVCPTDIFGIHDYRRFTKELSAYYSDPGFFGSGAAGTGHPYLVPGEKYSGGAVMLTEFGGVREYDGFTDEIAEDVDNVLRTPTFCGCCYTQLTDVYQEQNGLLFMDRTPKADIEIFSAVFSANKKI